MSESNLKPRKIWHSEYRGIKYEINNYKMDLGPHSYFENGCWTYYLHLMVAMFPKEIQESLMPKLYYTQFGTPIECPRNNPLENLDWHGGITWLSNETKPGHPFVVLKVGCDYQHLWDEQKYYDLETIDRDARACIDSLHRQMPPSRTLEQVWDSFREKFPKDTTEHRQFDIDGKPIEI